MAGSPIPATGVAWDTAIPDDGQPHGNDYNEHRETKLAVGIRMAKEHVAFAGTSAGGEHKPGSARIYVGDYSSASAGDALPTTKPDGTTALDSDDAGCLAWDTDATYGRLLYKWSGSAWEACMVSLEQAQTVAGVKTFSSFPVTPSSAPTTDYQVANKKYVDDQVSAPRFGSRTNEDDDSNAMVVDHAYLANQDGFVIVVITYAFLECFAKCYVDTDSNPASGGTLLGYFSLGQQTDPYMSFIVPVASGEYFEVVDSGTITLNIYWQPIGTLVKCTDQD